MPLSWIWTVLAGPFVGSLLGVLVRRLPAGRPVAMARSACESCGHPLGPTDLVPIASYLWHRGRCGHCGSKIAPMHLSIELAATAVALWAVQAGLNDVELWAACIFGWGLLALAWIDWLHFRLPDALTLPLLLLGLAATAWLDPDAVTDHALAAALGYALLRLVAFTYWKIRHRHGLGLGDAKLVAAIGAWLGIAGSADTLLLGAVFGLVFGTMRLVLHRTSIQAAIPFGPFLAAAAWIVELYVVHA